MFELQFHSRNNVRNRKKKKKQNAKQLVAKADFLLFCSLLQNYYLMWIFDKNAPFLRQRKFVFENYRIKTKIQGEFLYLMFKVKFNLNFNFIAILLNPNK